MPRASSYNKAVLKCRERAAHGDFTARSFQKVVLHLIYIKLHFALEVPAAYKMHSRIIVPELWQHHGRSRSVRIARNRRRHLQ